MFDRFDMLLISAQSALETGLALGRIEPQKVDALIARLVLF